MVTTAFANEGLWEFFQQQRFELWLLRRRRQDRVKLHWFLGAYDGLCSVPQLKRLKMCSSKSQIIPSFINKQVQESHEEHQD
ncbi:hypothetical protein Hdeb2414_s0221g00838171 [Helianthus debilis subsp. tardiflorus]